MGQTLGENRIIKLFFKGVRNIRPPAARYETSWDPRIVLKSHLKMDMHGKNESEIFIARTCYFVITYHGTTNANPMSYRYKK